MVRGSLATPSIAAMRPLVTAGPIGRASIAPKVAESTFTSAERTAANMQAPASSPKRGDAGLGMVEVSLLFVLVRRLFFRLLRHMELRIVGPGHSLHVSQPRRKT